MFLLSANPVVLVPSLSPRQLATQEKTLKTDAALPDLKHAHEIADVVDGRRTIPNIPLPQLKAAQAEDDDNGANGEAEEDEDAATVDNAGATGDMDDVGEMVEAE